ncbi:MAG: hypothetical protein LBF79_04260, partial [Dysgonamonadaceae bacterium]|nr:hypothetical protein [Dysgonamonadaceae bacterium]
TVYVSPGYEPVELVGKWISEKKDTINFLGYWGFVYEPIVPLTGVMRPYAYICHIGKDSISAALSYSSNSNDWKTYYFHYSKEQIEIRGFQNYEKGVYVRLK